MLQAGFQPSGWPETRLILRALHLPGDGDQNPFSMFKRGNMLAPYVTKQGKRTVKVGGDKAWLVGI